MILVYGVGIGLVAGLLRAWLAGHPYELPGVRLGWLAAVAFVPQLLAFMLPVTRNLFPDYLAAAALVFSQALLLTFVWANRKHPGFWLLGIGLGLNLLVIVANGGLMPISPEILSEIAPKAPPEAMTVGQRFTASKDIILPVGHTRFWFLSDRFITPYLFPYRVAFSFGDILIGLGALRFLFGRGGSKILRLQEAT